MSKGIGGSLYLVHTFEGKQLVREYIANTLMGIEYLWGGPVYLETSEAQIVPGQPSSTRQDEPQQGEIRWQRVIYTMSEKVLSKKTL